MMTMMKPVRQCRRKWPIAGHLSGVSYPEFVRRRSGLYTTTLIAYKGLEYEVTAEFRYLYKKVVSTLRVHDRRMKIIESSCTKYPSDSDIARAIIERREMLPREGALELLGDAYLLIERIVDIANGIAPIYTRLIKSEVV